MLKFIFFIAMIIWSDQVLSSTIFSDDIRSDVSKLEQKKMRLKLDNGFDVRTIKQKKKRLKNGGRKLGLSRKRKKNRDALQKVFKKSIQPTLIKLNNQEKISEIKNSIYNSFIEVYVNKTEGFLTVSSTITELLLKNVNNTDKNENIDIIIKDFIITQIKKNVAKVYEQNKDIGKFDIIIDERGIVVQIIKQVPNNRETSVSRITEEPSSVISTVKSEEVILITQNQIDDIKNRIKKKFLVNTANNIIALSGKKNLVVNPDGSITDGQKIIVTVAKIEMFLTTGEFLTIDGKTITNDAWVTQESKLIFEAILNDEVRNSIRKLGVITSSLQVGTLCSDFHTSVWEMLACLSYVSDKFKIQNNYYQYYNKTRAKTLNIVDEKFITQKLKNAYSLLSIIVDYVAILKELIENRSSNNDTLENFFDQINILIKNKIDRDQSEGQQVNMTAENSKKSENDQGWLMAYITMLSVTIVYIQEKESTMPSVFKKEILKTINTAFQTKLQGKIKQIYGLINNDIFYKNIFDHITFDQVLNSHYIYNQDINKIIQMKQDQATRYKFDFMNDDTVKIFCFGMFGLAIQDYILNTIPEEIFASEKNIDHYFNDYFYSRFEPSVLNNKKQEILDNINNYNNFIQQSIKAYINEIQFDFQDDQEKSEKHVQIITKIRNMLNDKNLYKNMVEENGKASIKGVFQVNQWAMSKKFLIWVNDNYQTPIEGLTTFKESDFNLKFNLMYPLFNELMNTVKKTEHPQLHHNDEKTIDKIIFTSLTNEDYLNDNDILRYLFQLMFNTNIAISIYESEKDKIQIEDASLFHKISRELIPVIKKLCYCYAQYVELLYLSPEAGNYIDVTKILYVTGGLLGAYIGIGSMVAGGFGSLVGATISGVGSAGFAALGLTLSNPLSAAGIVTATALYKYRGVIANWGQEKKSGLTAWVKKRIERFKK